MPKELTNQIFVSQPIKITSNHLTKEEIIEQSRDLVDLIGCSSLGIEMRLISSNLKSTVWPVQFTFAYDVI